ncbi:putative outer membrane starch-binding protein [Anseongella ginsenosidimutans]|uniref:Putative outer membrane starch-binding protein n=1 Tax=Anseongella ginsenosidimutans TaxID=496056 RepID=A0A4R3KMJ1_9SPHI|nr:RagB/SusD family nutrient uptake outer membrane protein [Anseongella ginsenosidimutans]QEC52762.1 RagB/SusD family nutrient uptake outer membrane protein [Anseongella ginsenosidimutans]TCS85521.1 putative outer membrane starch-binding protein [Anseongella ginsenosidimutans]
MKKARLYGIAIAALLMQAGCTDLSEEVYDKLPVGEFGNSEREINALVAPIYRTLKGVYPSNFFLLSECSSDMAITPTRKGGDWWDGGQFKELRLHTWTPNTAVVRDSYNSAFSAITSCNKIYSMVEENPNVPEKEQVLAEIRGMRAYWYYMLLDYFGNVPIVTDFENTELPSTNSRKEVYEFVVSELNAIKDIVRSDVTPASYGKVTQGFVYTLLAKMYLNAEVWNPEGGAKWQECIDACNKVMELDYILEPDWKTNFIVQNENSKEIIFPVVFSTADGGNHIAQRTLHYLDPIALGLKIGTWNGISAMPEYVEAFDPDDKRLAGSFLTGPMLDPATGEVLITAHNRPLIHTVDITLKYNMDADGWGQVEQEDGARCFKWEFESGLNGDAENDFGIFRLADVYLMKAEALVRSGGSNAEATTLVNKIRERAFDDPSKLKTSVTLDDIYQERRFELAWEATSRQDNIRFGKFLDAIPGWKGATPEKCLLFPIPITAINANDNLEQNPGY